MKLQRTTLLTLLLAVASCLMLSGQTHNMSYQGSDTATSCTGTLYDNGGSTGNYSNYSNDYFVLDVSGSSLSITFTQFYTYHYSDRIRIYDGVGTTGTLLLNHSGSYLPNNGSAINVPSGKATIHFYSNYYGTGAGFTLNWSAGSTAAPTAQFSVSNPNPPVNTEVSFTNSSNGGGTYLWNFGDGNSSTKTSPKHSYAAAGTYPVSLTATNCFGSTTSSTQNVTVMAAPHFTINPDSLYASVTCGTSVNTNFTVTHDSGGTMLYNIAGRELGSNPYLFATSFEQGLTGFVRSPNAYTSFTSNIVTGSAAAGNNSLLLTGWTTLYNGLIGSFTSSQPTAFSYYIKPSSGSYHGEVALANNYGTT